MRVKLNIFEISNIIRVTDYGASCPLEVSIKDNSKFILKTKYNEKLMILPLLATLAFADYTYYKRRLKAYTIIQNL